MSRGTLAPASTNAKSGSPRPDRNADLEDQLERLGRPVRTKGTSLRPRRIHVFLVALAIVSVWIVFVFARALGDLDRASARQAGIASEANALQARLDADRRELQLVQTDGFQRLQARSYGLGAPGEQVFSLGPGAPSPPPIVPLGGLQPAGTTDAGAQTPLDAWLNILFGN
jgi:hypothetical protein